LIGTEQNILKVDQIRYPKMTEQLDSKLWATSKRVIRRLKHGAYIVARNGCTASQCFYRKASVGFSDLYIPTVTNSALFVMEKEQE